jgi:hypothetical protein
MRPVADRSLIDALPTALGRSLGRSATSISSGGPSRVISISRTEPWASASTSAACANVTERSSGLTCIRSDTSTMLESRLGSRKVRTPPGVTNTARLDAIRVQNSSSSSRSSTCSRTPAIAARSVPAASSWRIASVARFLNSMRSRSASCGSGLVGR